MSNIRMPSNKPLKVNVLDAMKSMSQVFVVVEYMNCTQFFEDDDEEDLQVVFRANGQNVIDFSDNFRKLSIHGGTQNKSISLLGIDTLIIEASFTCLDYHRPHYGTFSQTYTAPFPNGTIPMAAALNGGAWDGAFRIVT